MRDGIEGTLPIEKLLSKRGTVTETSLPTLPCDAKADVVAHVRENVWLLIESGVIRPVVDGLFPLTKAARAHEELDAGTHVGKALLPTA